MKKMITLMPLTALALGFSVASASAGFKNCTSESVDKWMSTEKISSMLSSQGYQVRKVKREGNCLEAYAIKDGTRMEVYVNPVNGAIVKTKIKG
jgi:hypothetical protein